MSKPMAPDINTLSKHYQGILEVIGEDTNREGLTQTPGRAAKAMAYLCSGYGTSLDEVVNGAIFESETDEMVVVRNIELYSLCEHHMLPFIGQCHIAYIPNGKVLGLSKFARIVDMYARRLQIQEHLTKAIAEAIETVTNAKGVGVIVEARHMCMMMRGVEKQNSVMTSSVLLGLLKSNPLSRQEFLSLTAPSRL